MSLCNMCNQLQAMVNPVEAELKNKMRKLKSQNFNTHIDEGLLQWICEECEQSVRGRYIIAIQEEARKEMLQMQLENEKLRKMISLMQNSVTSDPIEISSDEEEDLEFITGNCNAETVAAASKSLATEELGAADMDIEQPIETHFQISASHANHENALINSLQELAAASPSLTIVCKRSFVVDGQSQNTMQKITPTSEMLSNKQSNVLSCSTEAMAEQNLSSNRPQLLSDNQLLPAKSQQIQLANCSVEQPVPEDNLLTENQETFEIVELDDDDFEPAAVDQLDEIFKDTTFHFKCREYFTKCIDYYDCKLCTTTKVKFTALSSVERHIKRVHFGFQYICTLCNMRLPYTYVIQAHYRTDHEIEPPMILKTVFSKTPATEQNKRLGAYKPRKRRKKSEVFGGSEGPEKNSEELYSPQQEQNSTTVANKIDAATFDIQKSYERIGNEFVCLLCPRGVNNSYMHSGSVIYHINADHLNVRYECKECGVEYRSVMGLRYHMNKKHNISDINAESTNQLPSFQKRYKILPPVFPNAIVIATATENNKLLPKAVAPPTTNKEAATCSTLKKAKQSELDKQTSVAQQTRVSQKTELVSITKSSSSSNDANSPMRSPTEHNTAASSKIINNTAENNLSNQTNSYSDILSPVDDQTNEDNELQPLGRSKRNQFSEQLTYAEYYEKTSNNYFLCKLCSNSHRYSQWLGFLYHLKSNHFGVRFQCSQCNSKYTTYHFFKQHFLQHHAIDKKTKIPLRNEVMIQVTTSASSGYRQRKRYRSQYKKSGDFFVCKLCPAKDVSNGRERFRSKHSSSLRHHIITAHIKKSNRNNSQQTNVNESRAEKPATGYQHTLLNNSNANVGTPLIMMGDNLLLPKLPFIKVEKESNEYGHDDSAAINETEFITDPLGGHIASSDNQTIIQDELLIELNSKYDDELTQSAEETEDNKEKLKKQLLSESPYRLNENTNELRRRKTYFNQHYKKIGKAFQCSICWKKYDKQHGIIYHMRTVHLGLRYECGICDIKYLQLSHVRQHYLKEHKELDPPSRQTVKRSYSNIRTAGQRSRSHYGSLYKVVDDKFECNLCAAAAAIDDESSAEPTKQYANRKAIILHLTTKHSGCKLLRQGSAMSVEKKLKPLKLLPGRRRSIYGSMYKIVDGKFECLFCAENHNEADAPLKQYANRQGIILHLKAKHCGRQGKDKSLEDETPSTSQSHPTERRRRRPNSSTYTMIGKHYLCNLCPAPQTRQDPEQYITDCPDALRSHIKEDHFTNPQCQDCGRIFSSKSNLYYHNKHKESCNRRRKLMQSTNEARSRLRYTRRAKRE